MTLLHPENTRATSHVPHQPHWRCRRWAKEGDARAPSSTRSIELIARWPPKSPQSTPAQQARPTGWWRWVDCITAPGRAAEEPGTLQKSPPKKYTRSSRLTRSPQRNATEAGKRSAHTFTHLICVTGRRTSCLQRLAAPLWARELQLGEVIKPIFPQPTTATRAREATKACTSDSTHPLDASLSAPTAAKPATPRTAARGQSGPGRHRVLSQPRIAQKKVSARL